MPQPTYHTGTRDDHFDLISVAYHALQGAAAAEQYLRDAQAAGDAAEIAFFQNLQQQYRAIARQAQDLLSQRLVPTLAR